MGEFMMRDHCLMHYLAVCEMKPKLYVYYSWNLPGPDNYALQYADGVQTYITESVSETFAQIIVKRQVMCTPGK